MVKIEVSTSTGLEMVLGRDGQTDGQTDRITVANTRYSYLLALTCNDATWPLIEAKQNELLMFKILQKINKR